jgi:hypothetical protein
VPQLRRQGGGAAERRRAGVAAHDDQDGDAACGPALVSIHPNPSLKEPLVFSRRFRPFCSLLNEALECGRICGNPRARIWPRKGLTRRCMYHFCVATYTIVDVGSAFMVGKGGGGYIGGLHRCRHALLHGRCDQLADAIDFTCSFDPKPVRLVGQFRIFRILGRLADLKSLPRGSTTSLGCSSVYGCCLFGHDPSLFFLRLQILQQTWSRAAATSRWASGFGPRGRSRW